MRVEAIATTTKIVNGVDVTALVGTIGAIKGNAEIAKFTFRAKNMWMGGDKNRTTIKEFTGVLQEHRSGAQEQTFVVDNGEISAKVGDGETG